MKLPQRQVADPRAQENFEQLQSALTPEAWREIGATGQPAFQNSWVNVGGAYETAGFRFVTPKLVAFKGSATGGVTTTAAFTLPAAYRPAKDRRLPLALIDGAGNVQTALLYITTAGLVVPYSLSAAGVIDEAHIEGVFAL